MHMHHATFKVVADMSLYPLCTPRSGQRGFTLVEVLVAVSLLSIIMVALGSGMRTMAQTESRVDQRLSRMDELRVVNGFLRQVLTRVSARKNLVQPGEGGTNVLFRATATSIEWVGIMPPRHGMGGRFFFRLQPEESPNGMSLVLRFAPWGISATEFPDWNQAEARILVRDITRFDVFAEGRPKGIQSPESQWPNGWVSGWPISDQLPQRLRLQWSMSSVPWPDLVVSVQDLTQGISGSGGFVIGGAR